MFRYCVTGWLFPCRFLPCSMGVLSVLELCLRRGPCCFLLFFCHCFLSAQPLFILFFNVDGFDIGLAVGLCYLNLAE